MGAVEIGVETAGQLGGEGLAIDRPEACLHIGVRGKENPLREPLPMSQVSLQRRGAEITLRAAEILVFIKALWVTSA